MALNESATVTKPDTDSYDAIAELLTDADEQDNEGGTEVGEQLDSGLDATDDDNPVGDDAGTGDAADGDEPADADNEDGGELTWSTALGLEDNKIVLDDETGALKGILVKVGDETSVVDVPTLVRGYQTDKYNTQRSQQIAEERKQVEEVTAKVVENYKSKLTDVEKLTEILHNSLLGEYQRVDWEKLRVANPGEYAAMLQDFRSRSDKINEMYEAIQNQKAHEEQEQVQVQQQQKMQRLEREIELTLEKNPEWATPEAFKAGMEGVTSFFQENYGIEPNLILNLADHRIVEVFKDAKKGRELSKVAVNKLPKTLPKMMKSAGASKPSVPKSTALSKAAQKASGNKQRALQTDAIAALLLGE
jgi:hypothetical protein